MKQNQSSGLQLDYVITNGLPSWDTVKRRRDEGWGLLAVLPATTVHPHAQPTDMVAIFSKYEAPSVTRETVHRFGRPGTFG